MAAFSHHRAGGLPFKTASAIAHRQAVKLSPSAVGQVVLAATVADEPFGVTIASAPVDGQVEIYDEGNVVHAVAGGSVGHGAAVGVASSNGRLSPTGLIAASGHWEVGVSLSAAAAGEGFALYVRPRKVA